MEQQTVKSMTNEQLIGACVWLDREQKKSRAMMNSYKAELQARGLAIMEDHNVKYVNALCELIDAQPIAFDLDKVVEQLKDEQELSYADFEIYAEEHGLSEDDDWHYRGLGRAVEIVKRGGVDGKIN